MCFVYVCEWVVSVYCRAVILFGRLGGQGSRGGAPGGGLGGIFDGLKAILGTINQQN